MRESANQKNSEYGHFSRSANNMNEWIDEMNYLSIIHNIYKFVSNRLTISKYFYL